MYDTVRLITTLWYPFPSSLFAHISWHCVALVRWLLTIVGRIKMMDDLLFGGTQKCKGMIGVKGGMYVHNIDVMSRNEDGNTKQASCYSCASGMRRSIA